MKLCFLLTSAYIALQVLLQLEFVGSNPSPALVPIRYAHHSLAQSGKETNSRFRSCSIFVAHSDSGAFAIGNEGDGEYEQPTSNHLLRPTRALKFWADSSIIYSSYKLFQMQCRARRVIARIQGGQASRNVDIAISEDWKKMHELNSDRMINMCLGLRGFYLKAGQFLGTRHDIMPKQYIRKLSQLHDSVPPMEGSKVRQILEQELGGCVDDFFSELQLDSPIGSASVAQVHKGVWKATGQTVAVKVQYPNAPQLMRGDLKNLRFLAEFLQRTEFKFDLLTACKELQQQIRKEFDFRNEASNIERVGRVFHGQRRVPEVRVPAHIASTRRALVMTFLDGVNLGQLAEYAGPRPPAASAVSLNGAVPTADGKDGTNSTTRNTAGASVETSSSWKLPLPVLIHGNYTSRAQPRPEIPISSGSGARSISRRLNSVPRQLKQRVGEQLLHTLAKAWGVQLFEMNAFHADPHPGNICLSKRLGVGLMDWGQVKEIPELFVVRFAHMVEALHSRRRRRIVEELLDLGVELQDPEDLVSAEFIAVSMLDTRVLGARALQGCRAIRRTRWDRRGRMSRRSRGEEREADEEDAATRHGRNNTPVDEAGGSAVTDEDGDGGSSSSSSSSFTMNPFSADSALQQNSVQRIPQDLFFVLRTVQLLRGLCTAFELPDYALSDEWLPYARAAIQRYEQRHGTAYRASSLARRRHRSSRRWWRWPTQQQSGQQRKWWCQLRKGRGRDRDNGSGSSWRRGPGLLRWTQRNTTSPQVAAASQTGDSMVAVEPDRHYSSP